MNSIDKPKSKMKRKLLNYELKEAQQKLEINLKPANLKLHQKYLPNKK